MNFKFLTILALCASMSHSAFAQTRKNNAPKSLGSKGADIGKGGTGGDAQKDDLYNEDIYYACNNATGVLKKALARALWYGQPTKQRAILNQGLKDAYVLVSSDYGFSLLTKQAVLRGLEIDRTISGACRTGQEDCLEREVRVAVLALAQSYDLIINKVVPLDMDYNIPYHQKYASHCRSYDCLPGDFASRFLVRYADSAAALLDFYLGTDPRPELGGRPLRLLPEALGSDYYELRVAERISKWAAADLNKDLFRRAFACVIADLDILSNSLERYNNGMNDEFPNSKFAVIYTRGALLSSLTSLRQQQWCSGYPRY